MEQIILNGLSLSDFLNTIEKLIDKKLNAIPPPKNTQSSYLGRSEVCELLKISLPTLNDWTKLGRLKSYKIGNRVLYRQDEIEDSLSQVSSLKFKRGTYGTTN